MKKTRELFLFRHGETDWNRDGRFQGHVDVPLNDEGRRQAARLITPLRRLKLEAVLASDLSRAHETGRILADALGIPIFTAEGLREAHLGDAQGLTLEQIGKVFGDPLLGRWRSSLPTDADISYPGGETGAVVMARAFEAMETFVARHPYQRIGVATHGGVIRRIFQRLLPPDSPPVPIPNGILYRILWKGSGGWEFEPYTPV